MRKDVSAEMARGTPCEERRNLGIALTSAVNNLYERRQRWEVAQKHKQKHIAEAVSALEAARETFLAAQLAYDEHVRTHGCLTPARASAAQAL